MPTTPNFLIIGAQKSATSSLYHYLKKHPEIFMSSPVKEPGYYLDFEFMQQYFLSTGKSIANREELLEKYMLEGYQNEKRFGEASTYYTLGDRSTEFNVPERIFSECPTMQFIYVLRNPFDRLISAFLHYHKYNKGATSTLDDFVDSDDFALSTSLYFQQLSAYLAYFPIHQFHFLLFENLLQNPQTILKQIFHFLNVPDYHYQAPFPIFNQSENKSNFDNKALLFSENTYDFLLKQFEKDLKKLEKIIACDLNQWNLTKEQWT